MLAVAVREAATAAVLTVTQAAAEMLAVRAALLVVSAARIPPKVLPVAGARKLPPVVVLLLPQNAECWFLILVTSGLPLGLRTVAVLIL
jgi:hypothetical protein